MGKPKHKHRNRNKNEKPKLSAEDKKLGKTDLYILISIIVIGFCLGLYYMQ